jgi:FdhD protein
VKRPGPTTKTTVWRVRGDRPRKETDVLAAEEPMEIRVESGPKDRRETTSLSVTMRTPGHDFELAAGFLFTEGILSRARDLARIEYCTDAKVEQEYNIVSAILQPGVCGKRALEAVRVAVRHPIPPDRPVLDPATIESLPERLREGQKLFSETGGLHAAGLFDAAGNRAGVREDVGRHNAVDKVVGEAFLANRVPLSDSILAVSGRSSFEILQKAAVAGIPCVVAVGAPSSLAVGIAAEFGMTLVGFARSGSFNVYSGMNRFGTGEVSKQAGT